MKWQFESVVGKQVVSFSLVIKYYMQLVNLITDIPTTRTASRERPVAASCDMLSER